jgi:hypothetical protein
MPDHDHVAPRFTFAEGLSGMAAVRDYVRLRRQHGQGEDAILGYFYDKMVSALAEAAEEHPEEYEMGDKLVQMPKMMEDE